MRLKLREPLVYDFLIMSLMQEIVNAVYKRAWITPDKAQYLRELVQTDTQRAISTMANILTDISTSRKVKNYGY